MGWLIHSSGLAPFLVTLAGMFFARGVALNVSMESIQMSHPLYASVSGFQLPLFGEASVPAMALLFIATLAWASVVGSYTRFGRSVLAIGGNETSAALMGLPLAKTKRRVYALSGFCSALAGVAYTFYTSSGNATAAGGLELDAIAAVVIGGTLLTGGSGHVLGTLLGVLILGVIQTAVTFENTVSSWWTRIAVGALLFAFILLQRIAARRSRA
jgi:galactofuranose transport system permease protein